MLAPPRRVEDDELQAVLRNYADEGWAALPGTFGAAAVDALRTRADELMLGRVVRDGLFFQLDTTTGRYEDLAFGKGWQGPSLNYRKLEKLEQDPLFMALIANPLFERLARALIAGPVTIYRAALMNKAAHGGTVLPWHQDGGVLWGLSRDPELQVWVALDDAPREAGCVEVIPGTHRGGLATPLGGMIPAAVTGSAGADARAVPVPAHAGDVLLIHNHVWHRSGLNRTGRPRRAVTICYMSAEVRCLRKRSRPRSFVVAFP
jgi:phytanoyl-CoA hydroxylase